LVIFRLINPYSNIIVDYIQAVLLTITLPIFMTEFMRHYTRWQELLGYPKFLILLSIHATSSDPDRPSGILPKQSFV